MNASQTLTPISGSGSDRPTVEPIVVPCEFLDQAPVKRVAVSEAGLIRMLSLDDGRSAAAAKRAAYEFRLEFGIQPLPGFVFSIAQVQEAVSVQRLRAIALQKAKAARSGRTKTFNHE